MFEQSRYVLESLPGISSNMAEILLAEFGLVRKMTATSEQELLALKGLGQTKVNGILKVLDGGIG